MMDEVKIKAVAFRVGTHRSILLLPGLKAWPPETSLTSQNNYIPHYTMGYFATKVGANTQKDQHAQLPTGLPRVVTNEQ